MLTKKQKELFDYLKTYVSKNSISPSFEEMRVAVNLKSKSGIHGLITSLEQRGFIKRLKHKARAMEIIKKHVSPTTLKPETNLFSIPLLGSISAGNPIEAISTENELISVPSNMINKSFQHFGLVVKGESMIEEGIMDGDIAIIKHTKTINNGNTWTPVNLPTEDGNDWASLAWHALAVSVHPEDPETLFIGGLELYRSTNGGGSKIPLLLASYLFFL